MPKEPFITDLDKYLFAQGTHERIYEKLGAHQLEQDGVVGIHFAVWAPNAKTVHLIGDFNYWTSPEHPMTQLENSGIWVRFEPGLKPGAVYKYRIIDQHGQSHEKSDPYGFAAELRPQTASVVADIDSYDWQDGDWLKKRAERQALNQPMSIYELHLGSWRRAAGNRFLTYDELAEQLISYVTSMGFTHVELLPIAEHPFDGSWGYQTVGYFAPTSRFGQPHEFQAFVDALHQAGIGVIIDWVPAHFPKDGHGLGRFDGTALYEHADARQGEHKDWGTYIFNYGRNEVLSFLFSNALFWLEKYHIDGLRVDAVASMLYLDYSRESGEWVPNMHGGRENLEAIHFLKRFNEIVHGVFPDVLTFAEESTDWPMVSRPTYVGGLGFDLKWNMGWMHDSLEYISKDAVHRRYHHNHLTFSLIYAFNENFLLPLSHDEVVHLKRSMIDKMPGDEWQKAANLRAYYGYMYGHPGKKLLFMGAEFAQWGEWNYAVSLDWHRLEYFPHKGVQRYIQDLNALYASESALYEVDFSGEGFSWVDFHDADQSVIAFLRHNQAQDEQILVVCNFTPVPRENYRLGVPESGFYAELLNSDGIPYWGSGMGNLGGVHSQNGQSHGYAQFVELTLPPLSTLMLKRKLD
ncbi:MAG: 1,4-alpha-glucan branching protein GlgB [Chloroflexota bacterium]